ncbi:MAG: hypothetical protein K6E12_03360 [Saccharofermentans sp.]|nr:hypothetical protein [Saccharofermentans sp.]
MGGEIAAAGVAAAGVAAAEFRGAFVGYLRLLEKHIINDMEIRLLKYRCAKHKNLEIRAFLVYLFDSKQTPGANNL